MSKKRKPQKKPQSRKDPTFIKYYFSLENFKIIEEAFQELVKSETLKTKWQKLKLKETKLLNKK